MSGIKALLFSLLLLACTHGAASNKSPALFPAPAEDFTEYISGAWQYLKENSLPRRSAGAIRLNLPFQLSADPRSDYRGKFLLIHGLNDSPFVWYDTAKELSSRGFDVRAILLPGHGSTPEDMLDVSYKQWLRTARRHFALWNVDSTPIYLGGFSMGGVIATILALENEDIDGLLLISPAYHSKLNHLLRWSSIYSRFRPWLFGGMILEDNPVKYNSIPINSGAQYYKITRYLKNRWRNRQISIPVLMVMTENDSVVDVDYVRDLFSRRFVSDHRSFIVYSASAEFRKRKREVVRNSAAPDLRIINQSHLSLVNAPDNVVYGGESPLLVCNGNEYPIFMACMRSREHWYGAQHTPSPDGVAVARTTFNPDFDFIFEEFDRVFLVN